MLLTRSCNLRSLARLHTTEEIVWTEGWGLIGTWFVFADIEMSGYQPRYRYKALTMPSDGVCRVLVWPELSGQGPDDFGVGIAGAEF